jgi:hypothetical protein
MEEDGIAPTAAGARTLGMAAATEALVLSAPAIFFSWLRH